MSDRPRVLYFGMPCAFSHVALVALLDSAVEVVGLVVPAPPALRPGPAEAMYDIPPPLVTLAAPGQEHALVPLAWRRGIPVMAVRRLDPAAVGALAAYRPDVIAVACFPRRLPPVVLALPRLGCLNVHPSLLPANRGPAPLFWTFRHGEQRTGVTVHLVSEELDAGDILQQEAIDVPEGVDGLAFEEHCAAVGGRLLVTAIRDLVDGQAVLRPQDPAAASYYPWPSQADLVVDAARPARWAYSFIRGVGHMGFPLIVSCDGAFYRVVGALGYEPEGVLDRPCLRRSDELWVQCTPGVLRVRLSEPVDLAQLGVGQRRE